MTLYSYWSIVLLSVYLYICTGSKVIELYITSQLLREELSLVWVVRNPGRVELCPVITS